MLNNKNTEAAGCGGDCPARKIILPELLAPAGNKEKLRAAFRFGADAVYLSGREFGMRSAADNFTPDEYTEAVEFAHSLGKRVYLTVNIMPHEGDYPALRGYLASLRSCPPDALIIADIGVLAAAREILPGTALHISTQANALSSAACVEWMKLGASRIILARELSFTEIRAIRRAAPSELELEAFIHGSMCVSYSGRCLISSYLAGRDANRGLCAQSCRWNYRTLEIEEKSRPGECIPVEEDANGTYVMSSRDLCMIEHIPELVGAGINSLKIEGRMKSVCYAATVTNAYRIALDEYAAAYAPSASASVSASASASESVADEYRFRGEWLRELEGVSRREYCTGYYFGNLREEANLCAGTGYIREKAYLADAVSYNEIDRFAEFVQRNKLRADDFVEIITPGRTGRGFFASELTDTVGNPISDTPHPGMRYRLRVPFAVKPGDIMRLVK